MKGEEIEALLQNTFKQFKSQSSSAGESFVLQRTVINILLQLLPCPSSDLLKCVEELLCKEGGDLEFKAFIFHIWTVLYNSPEHDTEAQNFQKIVNTFCKEIFVETKEARRPTKVPHQRKSQAENQSQRRDKVTPLQSEVITLLSSFLLSSNNEGATLVIEDIASSISGAKGAFSPLFACHIAVCILQMPVSVGNSKMVVFRERLVSHLCGFLHATRSGLRTYVIDVMLPAFYHTSTNNKHLQVLWESIALLQDEMDTLLYFFKFGALFLFAAKQEGSNLQIFTDKKLWDCLKKGVTASDSMPRKQSLYLLKNIVNLPISSWNKYIPWDEAKWEVFFSIYETLDESKSHLLKPIWNQIETLLPPATTSLAPFELEPSMASYWLSVLFARGLTHGNPNVRDLVLPSLLAIPPQVIQLESSFLFGTLLSTFNDLSLDDLDSTITKYSSTVGKFWSDYLHCFTDYNVAAQGFTTSLVEYMRDSATITTPAIIFLLDCLIQLGTLHEKFEHATASEKGTLLLSAHSLEYLRSILECRPIAESTVQNSKLSEKVLNAAIKLTDLGKGTHPPSAFDFPTLARFLSTYPLSFLRTSKLLPRVAQWIARFDHLDLSHLRVVLQGILATSMDDGFDENQYRQNLALFARCFSLRPHSELFAELVGELKSHLTTNETKSEVCLACLRNILEDLRAAGLDGDTSAKYSSTLAEILPSVVKYIKTRLNEFISLLQKNGSDEDDVIRRTRELQNYASFVRSCWKAFPNVIAQQSTNLLEMFSLLAGHFDSHPTSGYPIHIINSALMFWIATGQDIPANIWSAWSGKEMLPLLIPKLLGVSARGAGTKSNELVSIFISNKWTMLGILVEKAQDFKLSLPSGLVAELFSSGMEVLDQADYESLPSLYTFLNTLLYRNTTTTPMAFGEDVESNVEQLLEAAWKSFVECKRKTGPLIYAFIALIFHPVLFRVSPEKVRPYLRRAIVEFSESPRIASSVAAHFCGVCASNLSLAFSFLPEVVDMCLTTEPAHLFGLPQLPEYAMWSEGHGLVITALVAGLPKTSSSIDFLGQLVLALIEQNFINSEFVTREHSQHSQTNKRKVRMWVTLSALVEHLDDSSKHLDMIAQKVWLALQIKNHKNIRRLIQSFMLKFLHRHNRFIELGLFPLLDDTNLPYQVAASAVIISARVLLDTQSQALPAFWLPLFRKLVPWSFHFHHAVRTCAQVALYTLMESAGDATPFQDPSLLSMVHFLRTNKDCIRLRERQRWFALKKSAGATRDEKVEKSVDEHAEEGEDDEDGDEVPSIPMDLLEHVKKAVKEFQASMAVTDNSEAKKPESEKEETGDFQKRILPWQMQDGLPQLETRELKKQRQSIIIVASLIDNTPNIAGLVRTCEIFNVEAVVIGNKKIENEAQFQRVSVSAEKWVPILEVAPSNLPLFIKEKSALGYSILGVEQTAYSESLTTFEFPDKCVLVLGQEQHGIPADVIQLLDKCVEIPQLGMIRSLNVHVSASIVVWAYTQQHLREK